MKRKFLSIAGTICFLLALQGIAFAQLNNRPFSFRFGNGGMSPGGRQAIINQKLFGLTPENPVRDRNGLLFGLTRGPGNLALLQDPVTGEIIPAYRNGWNFTQDNPLMQAGVFNNYFVPATKPGYNEEETSGSTIDTWTAEVFQLK